MSFDASKEIRQKLIYEMRDGKYSGEDRLPRETVLAAEFGISRNHLRDVLAQLEREGFITRRHGVGTVINRHVINVKNRMDIETEFLDIIRQNGHEAAITYVTYSEEPADKFIAGKLHIPEGEIVLRVCRMCTADGTPAIYCEDIVEKKLIKREYGSKDLKPPIFCFLQEFCDIEAYMDLTQLHAVAADKKVADALEIVEGTPLLNMEELDYDIDGNIIFYSSQYFIDDIFEQTVLRKKL